MKMYILVRKEFDPQYRSVQGCHALAQYALDHPIKFNEWGNKDLIFLGVRFDTGILKWTEVLTRKRIEHSLFREPDLQNTPTALACYASEELFRQLPTA